MKIKDTKAHKAQTQGYGKFINSRTKENFELYKMLKTPFPEVASNIIHDS